MCCWSPQRPVSGSNNLHGLFFYDREPLDLQSSNLPPALEARGVTNTSSVARYQSVHADIGGPIMRDRFWRFYAFRNLNSDNWDARLLQHRDLTARARVHDAAESRHQAELPPQLESHAVLFGAVQQQIATELGSVGIRRFGVDVADRLPILDSGRRPHVDSLQPVDARSEVGGVWLAMVDETWRRRDRTAGSCLASGPATTIFAWGTAICTKERRTSSSRRKTAFERSGCGGFVSPVEIETYDTPFSFQNEVTHQWAFINDTWTVGRFSFNGGVRPDSFKPYYEEQGKSGTGPYQDVVAYRDSISID